MTFFDIQIMNSMLLMPETMSRIRFPCNVYLSIDRSTSTGIVLPLQGSKRRDKIDLGPEGFV
jgi:hypothetical protein